MTQESVQLLIDEEEYKTNGVHIGTQHKTADMKAYIERVRNDGLFLLDVAQTDLQIREAAKVLAKHEARRILFVSQRQYGQTPIKVAAKALGATAIAGRFMPGTMTNPQVANFMEPDVLVVVDPLGDSQAMREALNIKIPILGLCDSNNETKNLKIVIPGNNKGRQSLSLIYFLLTRQTLIERGDIKKAEDFKLTVEDFEASL